jgi:hypothetical protein
MSENDVKRIACDFVAHSRLDPCKLASVRRFARSEIQHAETDGDEWVVQFAFDPANGEEYSQDIAIVVVDDVTGQARLFETL